MKTKWDQARFSSLVKRLAPAPGADLASDEAPCQRDAGGAGGPVAPAGLPLLGEGRGPQVPVDREGDAGHGDTLGDW